MESYVVVNGIKFNRIIDAIDFANGNPALDILTVNVFDIDGTCEERIFSRNPHSGDFVYTAYAVSVLRFDTDDNGEKHIADDDIIEEDINTYKAAKQYAMKLQAENPNKTYGIAEIEQTAYEKIEQLSMEILEED